MAVKRKRKPSNMKGITVGRGMKRPTKAGAGMTKKGVAKYRRQNPGSKLQTAVTEKKPRTKAIKYEASIAQNVFHRSTCGWLRNTSLKNTIQFRDRVEAIQQGFIPCKNCRP